MTTAEILHLLQNGDIDLEGLLPWSSNYTFLARVHQDDAETLAVYKPRQGERPLWDFTQGTLCQRERAAYLVSEVIGWGVVPTTVMREGPHGVGSLQLFIEHDPECHYFTFEGETAFRTQLQQIALLDIVINNADRKGGHILLQESENGTNEARLWAIDHGVCFHSQYKLRTVVWEFAGTPIPDELRADLEGLRSKLLSESSTNAIDLKKQLDESELVALLKRVDQLTKHGLFLEPGPSRHYPWPPV